VWAYADIQVGGAVIVMIRTQASLPSLPCAQTPATGQYTVAITRLALAAHATLSSLVVEPSLLEEFSSDQLTYGASPPLPV
jgi:hypothetical protein